jgi:predicted MFS family arabinose efflux permease
MPGLRPAPRLARTLFAASAMTTVGAVPLFLLSAQSVLIGKDLDFGEARFGLAVSCFFGSAAVTALMGALVVDRLGRRRSSVLAGLLAAAGGAGMAGLVQSYGSLLVGMVVLGVANASLQLSSNLALATAVPAHRRGLGFGVKQSAVPLAILLGGLAVPTVGALAGWRWTSGITAAMGVMVAVVGWFSHEAVPAVERHREVVSRPPAGALAVTAIAMALASTAVNAMATFLPGWAFTVGLTPSQAGLLVAAGGALCIVSRVTSGVLADRRAGRNLPVVARQLVAGAVALVVVSLGTVPTLIAGSVLAFAVGWAWPGLLLFAVVRVGRDTPGAAAGALQAGAFVGGALGPALFGLLVSGYGYPTAWWAAAGVLTVAAAVLVGARRMFVTDIVRRPLGADPRVQ